MSFSYRHFGLCVAVIGPCSDICVPDHHTFLYDRMWSVSVPTPSEICINPIRWSRIFEILVFANTIKILTFLKGEGLFLYSQQFAHTHIYVRSTLILSFHLCLTPRYPKSCLTNRSSHRNFVCVSYFSRGATLSMCTELKRVTRWWPYEMS